MSQAQTFARVKRHANRNLLEVTALPGDSSDADFDRLVAECETAYADMPADFVLLFDLTDLQRLKPAYAQAWMRMFERVKPITKARLLCTCVVLTNPIVLMGANLFLSMYNPVKPFHMFEARDDALSKARSELKAVKDRVVDGHVQHHEQAKDAQQQAPHAHRKPR